VEDVQLARRVKAADLRLRMADAAGLIQTRMYHDWRAVHEGYAKNILAGHGNSVGLLLLSIGFHLAIFVAPWIWLLAGGSRLFALVLPLWPVLLILLGVTVRGLTAYATRQRIRDSWLLPISVLLMSWIALLAIWWRVRYGGPRWKGRVYPGGSR
jgi:chlorobactene glucosyltransferase